MRAHSTRSTPVPITLISRELWGVCVERRLLASDTDALQRGTSAHSSGVLRHCSEHFFHCNVKPHPNRPRHDRVTDVQLGQTRNLVDKLDILVVDAVAGVDLEI